MKVEMLDNFLVIGPRKSKIMTFFLSCLLLLLFSAIVVFSQVMSLGKGPAWLIFTFCGFYTSFGFIISLRLMDNLFGRVEIKVSDDYIHINRKIFKLSFISKIGITPDTIANVRVRSIINPLPLSDNEFSGFGNYILYLESSRGNKTVYAGLVKKDADLCASFLNKVLLCNSKL